MTNLLLITITAFAALFTADFILTLKDCWEAAKPKTDEAGVIEPIPQIEQIVNIDELQIDEWLTSVSIPKALPRIPEAPIMLCLPPAKPLTKSLHKMIKAELQHELRLWGKNDRGTNNELKQRLIRCYAGYQAA